MVRTWSQFAAVVLAVAVVWGFAPASASAQLGNGELYFAHCIPGDDLDNGMDFPNTLPVDVCVGVGQLNCVFAGVTFGEFRGPLELPPGTYQVTVALADPDNPGSNPPVISGTVAIRRRQSFTFAAQLDANGLPAAGVYQNNVDRISPVKSRVTVRHAAAAGPVDISLTSLLGMPGFAALALANGEQATTEVMSGPFLARITPAGLPNADLIPPQPLVFAPANAYLVFAVGTPANGSLQFLVHRIPLQRRLIP